jgi:hypothetical protein
MSNASQRPLKENNTGFPQVRTGMPPAGARTIRDNPAAGGQGGQGVEILKGLAGVHNALIDNPNDPEALDAARQMIQNLAKSLGQVQTRSASGMTSYRPAGAVESTAKTLVSRLLESKPA